MDEGTRVSRATILRLPGYLRFLQQKRQEGLETITSTVIANTLGLNSIQVRKDLAVVSSVSGKPKTGFQVGQLIRDLQAFLGYDDSSEAILVGVGSLGRALLSYAGFADYGLDIAAAFDVRPDLVGQKIRSVTVRAFETLPAYVRENNVRMGIVTVPKEAAQEVADAMIGAGIRAIWNFAPAHLTIPQGVAIRNEDMAASLAVLSKDLSRLSD